MDGAEDHKQVTDLKKVVAKVLQSKHSWWPIFIYIRFESDCTFSCVMPFGIMWFHVI